MCKKDMHVQELYTPYCASYVLRYKSRCTACMHESTTQLWESQCSMCMSCTCVQAKPGAAALSHAVLHCCFTNYHWYTYTHPRLYLPTCYRSIARLLLVPRTPAYGLYV